MEDPDVNKLVEDPCEDHDLNSNLFPPDQLHNPPFLLFLLGNFNLYGYQQSSNTEDLEHAIFFYRNSLSLSRKECSFSLVFTNLADALLSRYEHLGRIEDLEDSITFHQKALALRPPGHQDRACSQKNLADVLLTRYEYSGKVDDLDAAISLNRDAIASRGPNQPDLSGYHVNLANALSTRHKQSGEMEDLEESISLHYHALSLRSPGHPNRSSSLDNLANALMTRYTQLGRTKDLEECIRLDREALDLRQDGHPDRSRSIMNLASALLTRYRLLGTKDDLEDSILLYHSALNLHSHGHPDRFMSLANLSNALLTRYNQTRVGEMEDLKRSIAFYREAIDFCPPDHPNRSTIISNLADALLAQFQQSRQTEDLEQTMLVHEQAANDCPSFIQDRLRSAIQWAIHARTHRHRSQLSAYKVALRLLHQCLNSRLTLQSQQNLLATASIPRTLATDAASAAIDAGDLALAVEFLEQGRAMMWQNLAAYHSPLEQLRQAEGGGELADRFEKISTDLERLALMNPAQVFNRESSVISDRTFDSQLQRRRLLLEEWESTLSRIRAIQGFNNFLQTAPFKTLRSAATAEGPVVLVNISIYRSDAIILCVDHPPVLVTLPHGLSVDLNDQVHPKKLGSRAQIVCMLRFLWDRIVSPMVDRLAELGVRRGSRVWWCPTAALCGLPLHAAGQYQPGNLNLPDIYTSSYISTLSSLIRARARGVGVQPSRTPRLLVVGTNETLLRSVQDEADIIQQCGDFVDVLLGTQASCDSVLDGLKQHSWIHFAGHSRLGENSQPFQASLELGDDNRLSLLDLVQVRPPAAELAFLSACHTAEGDIRIPDENIHLSAALQHCGFRSVVGTLWEMEDGVGPMISEEFYKYMFRNPGKIDFRDAAYALRSAVQILTEGDVPVERLVMFVHIGA